MQHHEKRQKQLEFPMFRLVAKEYHAEKRADAAHEERCQEQCFFADTPLAFLRFAFIRAIHYKHYELPHK